MTTKILTSFSATEKDLTKINQYSRRKLNNSEVFTFSMILSSNDVDRDCEAFTKESLIKMAELFKGTTGILDHNAKSKNQIARIYKTKVIKTNEKTIYKKDKYLLKAWAYMVKNETTKDLILKIDAGIIKEVSVSCSVEKKICSICGSIYNGSCEHVLGKKYPQGLCYVKLKNPYDAYEWSFVAIPSQIDAGVVKNFGGGLNSSMENQLKSKAFIGTCYENRIKKNLVKLCFLNNFMRENSSCLNEILKKLSIKELEALESEFSKKLKEKDFSKNLVSLNNIKNKNDNLDFVV